MISATSDKFLLYDAYCKHLLQSKENKRLTDINVLTLDDLQILLENLREDGHALIAPQLQDGVIVYDQVEGLDALPRGITDIQTPGGYQTHKTEAPSLFHYVVGPHSWKKFLHLPKLQLWRANKHSEEIHITPPEPPSVKTAFIGVRACEVKAIALQDKVLIHSGVVDGAYKIRRDNAFILAVDCARAGGSCFCVSMQSGPSVEGNYDLALTEILTPNHIFLVRSNSEAGEKILKKIPHRSATPEEIETGQEIVAQTAANMGRAMPDTNIARLLSQNLQHPHWDTIASRCLSCANCTMVCPTCFCTTVEDVSDLKMEEFSRERRWDSCFNLDFSYLHGGAARGSTAARYRQWMTHKLSSWVDQFGASGCVGCGRCITWCPVGIDLTQETKVIYDDQLG